MAAALLYAQKNNKEDVYGMDTLCRNRMVERTS